MELNEKILHKIFRTGIFLKGIDGLFEIIGGILLILVKPEIINNFVKLIFQHELLQDPNDLIANFLINLSSHLSLGVQFFAAIYLLSHGIIKFGLIVGLWKRKLRAYILAEIVFTIFVIYQIYRFAFTRSIYLIFLTLLDLIIIILTWWEYKQLKNHSPKELTMRIK